MDERPERRMVARVGVPWHLSEFGGGLRLVRLLDLSSEGARIEGSEQLREGSVCYVDLPPALGGLRLTGRVVWSRLHKGEQTPEGDKHLYHQSGLAFMGMTAEQRTALAAALELVRSETSRTTEDTPKPETSGP